MIVSYTGKARNILSKIVKSIVFDGPKSHCNDKIYYSCVIDDTALFYWQGYILISSLIKLAQVNGSRIFVHMTQNNSQFENFLKSHNINIKLIAPWGNKKHCNKLQQTETLELQEADYVFLCDADLAVLKDLQYLLAIHKNHILGKVVDFDIPPLDKLKSVFDYFNVAYPEVNNGTLNSASTFDGNFNGGLYGLPGNTLKAFGKEWKNFASQMLISSEIRKNLGDMFIHVDQISFSLALKYLNYPYFKLSNSENCPVHIKNKDLLDRNVNEKVNVVHFHSRIDARGLINQTGNAFADDAIRKVNNVLQDSFHNSLFWDFRYSIFPELGSGIGSRGVAANLKLELLKATGVQRFESVLDVGCGDLEIIKKLQINNYVGADVSNEVIKYGKAEFPESSFYLLPDDLAEIDKRDLVICFDVLIHQATAHDYLRLLDFLVANTKTRLVVSGYTKETDKSHMCFFYENIYDSLNRTGEFECIYKIGEYRGLDVVVADKVLTPKLLPEGKIPNDITNDALYEILQCESYKQSDLLYETVCVSRSIFGWFTKHFPRLYEYPWLLSILGRNLKGMTIVDFGAGLSPLPIMLNLRGAKVHTIDNSLTEVDITHIGKRNEWGFLDYSQLCKNIESHNGELTDNMFDKCSIDFFYSISVIEHLSAEVRRQVFNIVKRVLKKNGKILLTVDLYKKSDNLWNYSEGKIVEDEITHGNLMTLKEELSTLGFRDFSIIKQIMPDSQQIDIAFVSAAFHD
jgi:2-polyprenyl-3-methyl-5-hydroxy-6-metoxy-1,4-benzoquinol methylase